VSFHDINLESKIDGPMASRRVQRRPAVHRKRKEGRALADNIATRVGGLYPPDRGFGIRATRAGLSPPSEATVIAHRSKPGGEKSAARCKRGNTFSR
jgi:hypothetical protein